MLEEQMKKLAPLVDLDILVYRCGFAADSQMKKEGVDPDSDYLGFALGNVKSVMVEVERKFDGSKMRSFLTGSGNFREQVATLLPYKGNRDPNHKPKYYKEIKQYLKDFWNAEIVHGREADDAISCAQWEAKDKSTVIVSIDKDLDNTPGWHYHWTKNEFYYVNLDWANRCFWKQVLVGDRVDNVPGLVGVGDITADKILGDEMSWPGLRAVVESEYRKRLGSGWEAAFHENATLVWIQRVEGINYDKSPY